MFQAFLSSADVFSSVKQFGSRSGLTFCSVQGRRRIFKSGPAEEAIEYRRHERGRAREGDYFPSGKGGGGLWASPKNFF